MRLLNVHTLEFRDTLQETPPPYAIASHRWQKDELTYRDVRKNRKLESAGRQKLDGFINFVKSNVDVDWLWMDTCCIDKRDKTELEYAINCMFGWYKDAQICLAYLQDVSSPEDNVALESSEWFRRGWTLQELIAPKTVVFLSANWQIIGHKGIAAGACSIGIQLNKSISHITGIPEKILCDYVNSKQIGVAEKLGWMDQRQTSLAEDRAHCLLGLLDISMRISYGGIDAGQKAMDRLLAKLSKKDGTAARSDTGTALQPLPYQVNTGKTERQVFRASQHTALGRLVEQVEKVSQHLVSVERHSNHSVLARTRLIASCNSLSAQTRSLERYRDRGILDMPLFLQCMDVCAADTINVGELFEQIVACADDVLEHDGIEETYTLDLHLLENIEQAKSLLNFALQTYHDVRHGAHGMRQFDEMCKSGPTTSRDTAYRVAHADVHDVAYDTSIASRTVLAATDVVMTQHSGNDSRLTCPHGSSRKKRHGKRLFQASLRMPWFSRTIWDIAVIRSQHGWSYQLVSSYQVPSNAPIFQLCWRGDLEGMQRLVSSGSASLRDMQGDESLLAVATLYGHIQICKYLLSETEWSDQDAEMHRALLPWPQGDGRTKAQCKDFNEDLYRLFIDQHCLNVDIDDNADRYARWWLNCPPGGCLNIVLNNMPLPWSSKSIPARFRHATMLFKCSAEDFLRIVGLAPTDPRWSSLRGECHDTALHYVARRLSKIVSYHHWTMNDLELDPNGQLREWQVAGIGLMTTGLDVNATTTNGKTAFMQLLDDSLPWEYYMRPDTYRRVDYLVQLWRGMIERSNLNVREYVSRENVAMKSSRMAPVSKYATQFGGLDNSSHPSFWSAKVLRSTSIYVWSQEPSLPGSYIYETGPRSIPKLAFTTMPQWGGLDSWILNRSVLTRPALIDIRQRALQSLDALPGLIETTQDDAGIVQRLLSRSAKYVVQQKRSSSAPPMLHRSKEAYHEANRSSSHPWLPPFHLCPRDAVYRCDCVPEWLIRPSPLPRMNLNSCLREERPLEASPQDLHWRTKSFFAVFEGCRRRHMWINHKIIDPAQRHTFEADCPQGCGRIDPGQLERFRRRWPDIE